jgi:hypothetical protein
VIIVGQEKKDLEKKEFKEAQQRKKSIESKGYKYCVECDLPFKSLYGSIVCDECFKAKTGS